MKILAGMRRSGKTTRLTQEAIQNSGVLLVHVQSECHRLRREYPTLTVYTYDEWDYKTRGTADRFTRYTYIDNADLVLQHLLPSLQGFSLSVLPDLLNPLAPYCTSCPRFSFRREMYGLFLDEKEEEDESKDYYTNNNLV